MAALPEQSLHFCFTSKFIHKDLEADAIARHGDELARLGGGDVALATGTSPKR